MIMGESTVQSSTGFVLHLNDKKPIRVLHVDDEVGLLDVAKEFLAVEGSFRVETASSVHEAVEKMDKKAFDVIVCDYMMPGKDGLEFLEELRGKGNNIPFIVLTGRGREEVAIEALNLGADRYLNKTGDPETVYGELAHSIRQVVEKTMTEEMIRDSEEELRSIFEAVTDGIATIDTSGKVVAVNKALIEEMLGYEINEIIGENFAELGIIDPEELPQVLEAMAKVVTTGRAVKNSEVTLVGKDGHKIPTEISTSVTKKGGEVTGITAIVRDVTERKNAEELYRNIVELSPESIVVVDRKGIITSCSTTATRMLGYSENELIGKHFSRIGVIRVKDLPKYFKLFSRVLRGKVSKPIEFVFYRKDGTPLLCEVRVGLLKEGWKTVGVQAVSTDITERKKKERAILESQQKFKGLFKDNPEAAVYVDPDFQVLDINMRFEKLFGYLLEEIRGKRLLDLIVPQDKLEEGRMSDEEAKEGPIYCDTVRERKNGSLVPVSISAAPITVEGQLMGYIGLYKDITKQKRAEEELEESRRHFRALFNLMADPVAIVDRKGKILEVTKKAEEITGFKREELVGKNFLRTKIATAKSKAVMMKKLAERMMGKQFAPYEVEMLTKDGRRLPYEINATKIEYKDTPADIVVFRDISERKRMEEKLRVVGKLTRHDVRNKLSVITGNTYLAKKKLNENHKAMEFLGKIDSACRQVERIFDFAGNYERLGIEELSYVRVTETLQEAISLFSDLQGVEVVNDCNELKVRADSLLTQIFYNLIDNSLKYGEKTSQIRISFQMTRKNGLQLIYEDNGIGIPKGEKKKIFKEGYGRGTGYGLYLIKKICQVYGWTIQESGDYRKGARFVATIPRNSEEGKENYELT